MGSKAHMEGTRDQSRTSSLACLGGRHANKMAVYLSEKVTLTGCSTGVLAACDDN
jgi:hypothetical protein